jgi:hypothetical protein
MITTIAATLMTTYDLDADEDRERILSKRLELEQLDHVVHDDLMPGIQRPEVAIRILTTNSLQLTHYPNY